MSNTNIPDALRERVNAWGRYRCSYCLSSEENIGTPMEMDHILPESLGGPTEEENLCPACSMCNGYKSNRVTGIDPLTNEEVPLFNPRRQRWAEHFAWTPDGEQIIGLTAVGRATVAALKLNRPLLIKARRVWIRAGEHPPKD